MALTKATYSMIQGASANVLDFGADPSGATDSTLAIQNALNSSKSVIVPVGTYLISSTIAIPSFTQLVFQGSSGNTDTQVPASYFIKKSTMTTVAITLGECSSIVGGGLVCQTGNTGDGIQILGNGAKLQNVYVSGAGNDGIRVGNDSVYKNTNCFELYQVRSYNNGRYGINVNDKYDFDNGTGPDSNAGTIYQPIVNFNGSHGIYIGFAWWNTIIAPLCENNTGYGIYLEGGEKNTYPACRWTTLIGGDWNEGNVAGGLYDNSYLLTLINPDFNQLPVNSPSGLQGAGQRTVIGGTTSRLPLVNTARLSVLPTVTSSTVAGYVDSVTLNTNVYGLEFVVNNNGTNTSICKASTFYTGLTPSADNTFNLGHGSFRWGTVYAATGTINTSDENEKTEIEPLDYKEKAVALTIKAQIKKFKFKDAVEAKGNKARIHFGVMAQDVKAAFEAEGLNADDYGVFCADELEDGSIRLGVRYDELYAFILGAI